MSEIGGLLPAALPYLPDLLKAQGYRTAAFVGSIALDPRNGLAQGFDRGFQTYEATIPPPDCGRSAAAGNGPPRQSGDGRRARVDCAQSSGTEFCLGSPERSARQAALVTTPRSPQSMRPWASW